MLQVVFATAFQCSNTTTAMDVLADRDLTGETHVITGGDSGIGYATAMALAAKNATVILGCRATDGKYAQAIQNITQATGNSKVFIVKLDLSSFSSVRTFASELTQRAPVLHTLFCNAGIIQNPASLPTVTEDGFDRVFEVNFLSHFLLVEALLPALRRAKGRVVHVSSSGSFNACPWSAQKNGCMSIDNLPPKVPPSGEFLPGYLNYSNYGVTKYMQVFHAAELARREAVVTAYSLMPGLVDSGMTDWWAKHVCAGKTNCPLTAEEGAATSVYVGTASPTALSGTDGNYFVECDTANSVRSEMISSVGEAATLQYQQTFYDLCLKWSNANFAVVV